MTPWHWCWATRPHRFRFLHPSRCNRAKQPCGAVSGALSDAKALLAVADTWLWSASPSKHGTKFGSCTTSSRATPQPTIALAWSENTLYILDAGRAREAGAGGLRVSLGHVAPGFVVHELIHADKAIATLLLVTRSACREGARSRKWCTS